MTDDRFYDRAGPFTLAHIASHVGATILGGDGSLVVRDVAALDSAQPGDISVYSDGKYAEGFAATKASVVITSEKLAAHAHGCALLVTANPRLAFAQIGHLFYPPAVMRPGVATAVPVHPSASIGDGTQICAGVEIGINAKIGKDCFIGNNVVIGRGVVLGDNCRIAPNCVITHAVIGSRVMMGPNNSIGNQGFSFVPSPEGLLRVPQLGRVVIEDDVEFGTNCSVDRGAIGDTHIERGARFDNLVHIAHNVHIGHHSLITAQVGIAGSTTLGPMVAIGGQAGISDHLTIGAGARLAARAGVTRDVAAGEIVGGYPALPVRQWKRERVTLSRLAGYKPGSKPDDGEST